MVYLIPYKYHILYPSSAMQRSPRHQELFDHCFFAHTLFFQIPQQRISLVLL